MAELALRSHMLGITAWTEHATVALAKVRANPVATRKCST